MVLWMSEMEDMYTSGVVDVRHVHTRCGGCQTCTYKVWWMSDMYIQGVVDVRHVNTRCCGCQTCTYKVWWMSDMYIQGVVDVRDGGHAHIIIVSEAGYSRLC